MGLVVIDDATVIEPPNLPPTWGGTINPVFTQGVGGTYDLNQNASDPEDTLTYSLNAGSNALPSDTTLSSAGIITAGVSAPEGTVNGIIVDADDGVNSPVASPSFSINVTNAVAKRWNPGHYTKPQKDPFETARGDYYSFMSGQLSNQTQQIPQLKGMMFAVPWGHMESAPGVYNWTEIDPLIDQAEAQGQGIMILLHWKSFLWPNNQPPSPLDPRTWEAPADILNSKTSQHNQGWIANIWETSVASRYIAAMEAIANRYDDRPGMEAILTPEAVPSFGGIGAPPGYDIDDYAIELKRIYTAMSNAFTKTNVMPQINSLSGHIEDLFEHMYASGDGIGSPDARETPGWFFFKGEPGGGETPPRDYRTQLSRHTTISSSAFAKTGRTSAQIIDLMQDQQVTHAAWITTTNWEATKTAIQADPNLYTTCPSEYPSCEV